MPRICKSIIQILLWGSPERIRVFMMTANRNHPMRSLIVAEDIITVPILVFSKFKSIKILLITGSAEIERAVPINKAKGMRLSWA